MKKIIITIIFLLLFVYIGVITLSEGIKSGDMVSFIISIAFFTLSVIVILFSIRKYKEGILTFCVLLITIGVSLLCGGIVTTYKTLINTKDFISVSAKYTDREYYDTIRESGRNGHKNIIRYNITYTYTVNEKDYYIKNLEKENMIGFMKEKIVKYNPNNPNDSIIVGTDGGAILLFVGFMFILIPTMFLKILIDFIRKIKVTKKSNTNDNIFVSIILIIIGLVVYYIMSNETFSIINAFKASSVFVLFPLLFLILGIWNLIYCLYYKNRQMLLKLECIKINNYEYEKKQYYCVILKKGNNLLDRVLGKNKYAYLTKNESKFEIGKKYKVDIYKYSISLQWLDDKDFSKGLLLSPDKFKDEDFELISN